MYLPVYLYKHVLGYQRRQRPIFCSPHTGDIHIYIYISTYLSILLPIYLRAYTQYCFAPGLLCKIYANLCTPTLCLAPPPVIIHTIAQYNDPPNPLLLQYIYYTLLATAVSCKGQDISILNIYGDRPR